MPSAMPIAKSIYIQHQQRTIRFWRNGSVSADRDTLVADYSVPGINTSNRVAYHPPIADSMILHHQKIIPSGRNGSVRVDAVRQNRQRHPGGGLLRARHQYHASRCISPSHRSFTVSSRSVGLLF
jgi:hypothetical protein